MSIELEGGLGNSGSGGGGGGGSASKENLFEIKTMAEAVAEKGWAFLCKSTRQDLAKADVPTVYADILDKYNNADGTMNFSKKSIRCCERLQPRDIHYYNGWYYYVNYGHTEIRKTQDFITSELVKTGDFDYYNMVLCDDKLVFLNWNYLKVFNISNNELSDAIITTCHTNSESYSVIDNVLYFGSNNGWGYVDFDDLEDFNNLSTNIHYHDDSTERPSFKLGNKWYGVATFNLVSGDTFDNITTIILSIERPVASVMIDNYRIILGSNVYRLEENGTVTIISNNTVNCNKAVIYDTVIYTSQPSGASYCSKDLGVTFEEIQEEEIGIYPLVVSSYNLIAYVDRDGYVYKGDKLKTISKDTYVIDGNTVEIDYYSKDGFKICIADNTNDTNLATIYSYLGYYNYYRLDTTNETISLPRNSNLYSTMYVGDNYQDTIDGISGNATRLLPQAEIISDDSASVSLAVKGNKDYQLSASSLTALTISSCEDSALGTTIIFNSGATPTTITDSASIDWVDGATPIPSASVNCLIFIWNKIGFYKEW